jgi:alpha-amylase
MVRKLLVVLLSLSMLSWCSGTAQAAPPGERDAIVQLFEWNWNSVAQECGAVLGPKGYGAVQVSPPQEHVVVAGNPWWPRA